ncbi:MULTISPECIES: hypothetical protein [unclassified Mesorhizobium]|uniref:hypothetical protein n=1 Tax=unclassified Mesorhizobium TaxID=325217 RepID=UPI001093AAB3|nr:MULTISPECIES: hypothetical protein [unclassified Mesorhizobium]TGS46403.1 hypothetical protein EN825_12445 [Mesorhizobium sp. M8A.F.Ca.ET.182.01.1.1]TGS81860.1 hypothetical protein EN824_12680 [Mesorhizobium sp. M8A.F.Ca.ET.181.01.1.1]
MVSHPFKRSEEWHFRADFDEQRRLDLEASPAFTEIAEAICAEISPSEHVREPANDDRLVKCWRVKLPFSVRPITFDWFFNGPCGIRAQFLIHPELGRWATAHIAAMLRPVLLRELEREPSHKFDRPAAWSPTNSIDGLSSKVWINELLVHCNSTDLSIARWEAAAAEQHGADRRGLCAPTGSQLVFFGAWTNVEGVETILPEKIRRHHEIHKRGYS